MPPQTHFFPRNLPYGRGTRAHWASRPATKLIIFVHGFGGSTVGTWPNFPGLLPQSPSVATADIVFYGYDGRYTQANSSAISFFDFLYKFLGAPEKLINQTQPAEAAARSAFQYADIIIVAHSLGAVVTRRALLHGQEKSKTGTLLPWLETIRMVFFAPAHSGAYAAGIALSFLSSQGWFLGNLIGHFVRYKSPLLSDLEPESPTINELKRDTTEAIKSRKGRSKNHLVANAVVWAEIDKVVRNATFCKDPPPTQLQGKNHTQVCKPAGLTDPIFKAVIEHI
jgi:hypothetical protein